MAKYNYTSSDRWSDAKDSSEAIRQSMTTYLQGQLGRSKVEVEERIRKELRREIPKGLYSGKEERDDWQLSGARLIDVGAGQGGAVLEALHRGADAHGAEPGQEFADLARMRLQEDGFNPERIHVTKGDDLPFPDNSFDYAISLQVLEHVENPRPILEEIYRVLRPSGESIIRCENYLSFWEQHYNVPWIPLLPKRIGEFYLKMIGRDPSFLSDYVFYSTYPQVFRLAVEVGFKSETYKHRLEKARTLRGIQSKSSELVRYCLKALSPYNRAKLARWAIHMAETFSVGVELHLVKPV
jgi:ubiquinone/menaquinone biosynthesis C-methylase UbiE